MTTRVRSGLRRMLLATLGYVVAHAVPAFGQELEFHPVPRPTQDAVVAGPVVPAGFVARGKVIDDSIPYVPVAAQTNPPSTGPIQTSFAQDPPKTPVAPLPMAPMVPSPMPSGDPMAPPMTLVQPRVLSQPTIVGQPYSVGQPYVVGQPNMGQPTIVNQPTIIGQPTIVPGDAPAPMMSGMPGMPYGFMGHGSDSGGGCDSCGSGGGMYSTPAYDGAPSLWDRFVGGKCGTGCSDPCASTVGCRPGFWVRGEFLVYAATKQNAPPLATSGSSASQLPLGGGGAVLFDGDSLPHSPFPGGKASVGFWFPNQSAWGFDVTGMFLSQRQTNFNATSSGALFLGQPYFEVGPPPAPTGTEQAGIVAGGGAPGSISINAETRAWGFDPEIRRKLVEGSTFWLDGLVGYRYFRLQDDITMSSSSNFAGTSFFTQDHFGTRNEFNGFQLGIDGEWKFRPRWSIGTTIKVAVGDLYEQVHVSGTTTTSMGGQVQQFGNGFYAQPTNSGNFSKHQFSVLPEFGARLNFDVTDHLRIYAGYSGIFLNNVVRAGDQIDRNINGNQLIGAPLVGVPAPTVLFKRADFWAQGVSAGLEYHY
jgi:hypothetical protein